MMFNRSSFENSRPDGIAVLEIVHVDSDPPALHFVPLKSTRLSGEIAGPLAALQLVHVFGYSAEQYPGALEAVYRFPLPGDAAVSGVTVQFGEVTIQAELKEREEATAEYEKAHREGRQAVLTTRESPDVFSLQVSGIQPDQPVLVETSYVQLARADGVGWSLRIPLTTAPRYVRADETSTRNENGQPLYTLLDPGHRFSLDLTLENAGAVWSKTHELATAHEGSRASITLKKGEVIPDRDCVLSWTPCQETLRPTLQAIVHDDPASPQVYFLAAVSPPSVRPNAAVDREVILLVDHSGSMSGAKWQAADWAVRQLLSTLSPRDRFNLGLFHSTTRWLARTVQPGDAEHTRAASDFLAKHQDSGGTELGVALEQAISLDRTSDQRSRHVIVITDAEVSDTARILRLADEETRRSPRRRISVLCIDAAPNSYLAMELAERGGGVARFLTSSPEQEDITTALDEIMLDWSQPVLANLRLTIGRPGALAAGRQVLPSSEPCSSAVDLGDLPAGRSVWVSGRFPRGEPGPVRFGLVSAGEIASTSVKVGRESQLRPAIKSLFGARRLLQLEHLMGSGHDQKEIEMILAGAGYDLAPEPGKDRKVYAENTRQDSAGLLKRLLVREALNYGLASSETAFVATRREAGKTVDGTIAIGNALPHGWSAESASRGMLRSRHAASQAVFTICDPAPSYARPSRLRAAVKPLQDALSSVFQVDMARAAPPAEAHSELSMYRMVSADALDMRTVAPATQHRGDGSGLVFAGKPVFSGSEAVLFDYACSHDGSKLPGTGTISSIKFRMVNGAANLTDSGLELLIFVDDLAAPRARVRVADLVRQGGTRPLNIRRFAGQAVRIVLVDPAGALSIGAPEFAVELVWSINPR